MPAQNVEVERKELDKEREHDEAAGVELGRGTRNALRAVVQLAEVIGKRDTYTYLRRTPRADRDTVRDELEEAAEAAAEITEWAQEAFDELPDDY